ncbi:type II secretion system protein GspK (plasmid) [Skermanella rosea]|uniref:general secretion pathway protein GspK n=1 Tax=Skermanella rosea TaxID=1817965 RepID=UPI001933D0B2|nr:type II secretion system protein GspK [Skermanella rosea]UEM07196.1 type II secretion system protein GspK [Skermanella rosea]
MSPKTPGWRMNRRTSRPESQRGVALLSVLWTIMLLALIAANATTNSRTSVALARNHLISAQAEATADAGVHLAILALLDPQGIRILPEDGTPFDIPVGGGTVVLSVQDEAGLLNLNHATAEELARLMTATGMTPAEGVLLARAITSFRRPGPGSSTAWAQAAPGMRDPEASGNRFFDVVEELQQVDGITPAVYQRILPYVTADSRLSRLDPDVASDEVVYAVTGFMRAELDRVLTADPRPAREAPSENVSRNGDTGYGRDLRGPGSATRERIAPSEREVFVIRAQAATPGGGRYVRVARIYCSRDPELPYRVLGWTTGRPIVPTRNG